MSKVNELLDAIEADAGAMAARYPHRARLTIKRLVAAVRYAVADVDKTWESKWLRNIAAILEGDDASLQHLRR